MTIITRRQALTRLGTTSAALAVGGGASLPFVQAATISDTPENEELLSLNDLLRDALASRSAARAEIVQIADEWASRWPLAPEPLLGPDFRGRVNGTDWYTPEVDIAGRPLYRDTSILREHLSKKRRIELAGRRMAFLIFRATIIEQHLANWRKRKPTGRTPKALARNRGYRAKVVARFERDLELARHYDADTAHIRKVSGMNAAQARLAVATSQVTSIREAISHAAAFSDVGLRIKIEAVRAEMTEEGLNAKMFGYSMMGRVSRLAFAVAGEPLT